jgi:asparagine synthase (glutamine-hydrolysing)
MCGIIGAFGPAIPLNWPEASLVCISHRGPDSSGLVKLPNSLTMGAVRLAMTDPHPRSNQPMADSDSGDILTFNGEIYNYKELKEELLLLGRAFKTESDTEVLLYWIKQFGSTRISELQGMFAFAYYSAKKKTILFARDSLGKKPLYLTFDFANKNFAWSSSSKTLNNFRAYPEISREALSDYLALGYILDPNSPAADVFAVKPGEVIEVSLVNLEKVVHPRTPNSKVKRHGSLRDEISDAVLRRIEGHKKIALSLSGGVDSAIVALILAENGIKAKCFSASWEDSDKDRYNVDARQAEVIAQNLGLDFQAIKMISPTELESEIKIFLQAMEEPNNNPTGVSMIRLYKSIAEQGHRLVLTGDGADEVFAGYERHSKTRIVPNLFHFESNFITKKVLEDSTRFKSRMATVINTQIKPESYESWVYWHKLFSESDVRRMVGLDSWSLKQEIVGLSEIGLETGAVESLIQRDREIWLPMESNRKLDRVSMFFSIEARSPFQDDKVIALGKEMMNKSSYGSLDKVLLRDQFPELIDLGVRPDKAGFVSPLGHWLRENPELISKSLQCLVRQGILEAHERLQWLETPKFGNFKLLKKLWALLILGIWFDQNEMYLGANHYEK